MECTVSVSLALRCWNREIVDGMNEAVLAVGLFFEKGPAGFRDFGYQNVPKVPGSGLSCPLTSFPVFRPGRSERRMMQIVIVFPLRIPSGETLSQEAYRSLHPPEDPMVIEFSGGMPVFSDNPLGVSTEACRSNGK
jgi:hypothetical protein